ncbi:MAG: hypothetical protein EXR71_11915 [Myxococcales bacterium]|nr:hypothetical protein [Myxococcales bacterium]
MRGGRRRQSRDGTDNDADGTFDCSDSDCAASPECVDAGGDDTADDSTSGGATDARLILQRRRLRDRSDLRVPGGVHRRGHEAVAGGRSLWRGDESVTCTTRGASSYVIDGGVWSLMTSAVEADRINLYTVVQNTDSATGDGGEALEVITRVVHAAVVR